MVNGKADGLVRAIDWTYLDPDLVDFSLAVKSELYVTSEYLDVHSSDKQSLSSLYEMFRPLFLFFVECFVLFVLSFIFLNVLLHYTNRKGKKQNLISKTADTFFKFDKPLFKRPNAIGLFLIAFLLLEFLIQNIIQNSISASWVVVDTSQFVCILEYSFFGPFSGPLFWPSFLALFFGPLSGSFLNRMHFLPRRLTTSTEKLLKSKKKVCFIGEFLSITIFDYS